jgi:hypothetical protein
VTELRRGEGGDLVKEGLIRRVCSKAWEVGGGRHVAVVGEGQWRARPTRGRRKGKGGHGHGPGGPAQGNGPGGQWAGVEKRN